MGKHTKDFYRLCMKEPCEGDQAITDYKYEVNAYKAKLVEALMYVDQFRSLLNPAGKAHAIVTKFLFDDELNKMIGVEELLNAAKETVKKRNDNDLPRGTKGAIGPVRTGTQNASDNAQA